MAMRRYLPALCWIAIALGFLCTLFAPPEAWWADALMVAMLAAALLAVANGTSRYPLFRSTKRDSPIDTVVGVMPLLIALRAMNSFESIDIVWPILWGIPIGVAFAYGCYLTGVKRRWLRQQSTTLSAFEWIFLIVIGIGMGWGLIIQANGIRSRSTLSIPGKVVAKRISGGKMTQRYFDIEAKRPAVTSGEYRVRRTLYDSTYVGQLICVDIHTGLLGFRWYEVHHC